MKVSHTRVNARVSHRQHPTCARTRAYKRMEMEVATRVQEHSRGRGWVSGCNKLLDTIIAPEPGRILILNIGQIKLA